MSFCQENRNKKSRPVIPFCKLESGRLFGLGLGGLARQRRGFLGAGLVVPTALPPTNQRHSNGT
ncbi:hypothetical protein SAMN02744102_02141 [Paenibacillus barengoltzii]|nr:hypothetical protein SAMN02744102_02141 [Paenibacillus barengoltzii]